MPPVNKFKPHLFIVPEDDADRQIAVGFQMHLEANGRMQIVDVAGGWLKVVNVIKDEYVPLLNNNPNTHVLGIIDCDKDADRIAEQLKTFPAGIRNRIFLLGVNENPQEFKRSTKMHFAQIGEKLADECYKDELDLWNHEMLSYSSIEALRAKNALRELVFGISPPT